MIFIKMSSHHHQPCFPCKDAKDVVFSLDELILSIFSQMSFDDRLRARLVCRKWRQLSFKNINELIVGNMWLENPALNLGIHPRYKIMACNPWIHLNIFRTFLEEGGQWLQWLHVGKIDQQEHARSMIDSEFDLLCDESAELLIKNCPNLKSIEFEEKQNWSYEVLRKVIRHFGPQLEQVTFNRIVVFREFLQVFNPTCLRKLSFGQNDGQFLEEIILRFPLLTHFAISYSCLTDFKNLHRLTHLQSFVYKNSIEKEELDELIAAPFAKNLRQLKILSLLPVKGFKFLTNFPSLRSFNAYIDQSEYLVSIFQNACLLEELFLQFTEDMSYSSDHLMSISRLENLKRLELYFWSSFEQLELNKLPPMSSLLSFSLRVDAKSSDQYLIDLFLNSWYIKFPNVRHIVFWCPHVSSRSVIDGIGQLSNLQHFEFGSSKQKWARVKGFCKKKQINFAYSSYC